MEIVVTAIINQAVMDNIPDNINLINTQETRVLEMTNLSLIQ